MLAVGTNRRHWLVAMPLTAGEAQAARRYTDAVFGKDNAPRGLRHDDPFDLYDWHLKAYANMTQEQVDKFFEKNPAVANYKGLPLHEARVRVAREYTKLTCHGPQMRRCLRWGNEKPTTAGRQACMSVETA